MSATPRNLEMSKEEIDKGKTMAIVAYFIFFIPLLMDDMRKNKFAMYHTEQAIVLLILYFACGIIGVVTCGVGMILMIPVLVLYILGIINAANGQVKPVPVIGHFGEKINLVK